MKEKEATSGQKLFALVRADMLGTTLQTEMKQLQARDMESWDKLMLDLKREIRPDLGGVPVADPFEPKNSTEHRAGLLWSVLLKDMTECFYVEALSKRQINAMIEFKRKFLVLMAESMSAFSDVDLREDDTKLQAILDNLD